MQVTAQPSELHGQQSLFTEQAAPFALPSVQQVTPTHRYPSWQPVHVPEPSQRPHATLPQNVPALLGGYVHSPAAQVAPATS